MIIPYISYSPRVTRLLSAVKESSTNPQDFGLIIGHTLYVIYKTSFKRSLEDVENLCSFIINRYIFSVVTEHKIHFSSFQARYDILLKDFAKNGGSEMLLPTAVGTTRDKEFTRGTFQEFSLFNSGKEAVKEENELPDTQEDDDNEPKDLLAAMDSFDTLFCRRCLVPTQHLCLLQSTQFPQNCTSKCVQNAVEP